MKITAQEEYGLRLLLRIARCTTEDGLSIAQLSDAEGLSNAYVAKLTRLLRLSGFIKSRPGNKGGYVLARPAHEIVIKEVVETLGGILFDDEFCKAHAGVLKLCSHSVDCSARSLWQMVQVTVDDLLSRITLHDLINPEQESSKVLEGILHYRG